MRRELGLAGAIACATLAGGVSPATAETSDLPAQASPATPPAPAGRAAAWKRWDGTAALALGGEAVCSGSVVEFPDSRPGDKVLLLSAGHCIPGPHLRPGAIVVGRPVDPKKNTARIYKGGDDDVSSPHDAGIDKVVYATMTDTDIAVMELKVTYADLARTGVKARRISASEARRGDRVAVPSAQLGDPFEGCSVVSVGNQWTESPWSWNGLIEVAGKNCRHLRGGASGSPIVNESDGLVHGVVNTLKPVAGKDIHGLGPSARPLLSCIARGAFTASGCSLPRPPAPR